MSTLLDHTLFDAYEIYPVLETIEGQEAFCEPYTSLEEAQQAQREAQADGMTANLMWTVYGHIPGEGVEVVADHSTEDEAKSFLASLTAIPAHERGTFHAAL